MNSKLEQVLQLEPQYELKFKGKYSTAITSMINLINPSDKRVMFKIKTTAPKKYCVRPNSGILEPNERVAVSVCLQPYMYESGEKARHKFMVQSAFAPPGDINMEQIWKDIIPDHLMDSKLKCSFEIEDDENPENNNGTTDPPSSPKTTPDLLTPNTHKDDESYLKLENQRLRDQMLKLKVEKNSSLLSDKLPPENLPPYTNWFYFILSAMVGLIGVLFGKYYL